MGFVSPFPHGTHALSIINEYSRLRRWASYIQTTLHENRFTFTKKIKYKNKTSTFFGTLFNTFNMHFINL